MGLMVAFTFSGAATRFDERRHLLVQEANDIGTAYLRIDLLPAANQPAMRDLFRRYLDLRISGYAQGSKPAEAIAELDRSVQVQGDI